MGTQVETKDVGGWVPTRPRGPIAAMYSSPGPIYMLPTLVGHPKHDFRSVHPRKPAWAFGVRHRDFSKSDNSPGPVYLPNRKYYRDGPDGSPHFSLYGRHKDLSSYKTPGPGAYKTQGTGNKGKHTSPMFSFGNRHANLGSDKTPAPNTYSLPGMLGKTVESPKKSSPTYTLIGRSKQGGFHEDLSQSPGPGAYKTTHPNVYKYAPPNFSMTGRNNMPDDNSTKPGPGAHSLDKMYMIKKGSPSITFGMRHSQYRGHMFDSRTDDTN